MFIGLYDTSGNSTITALKNYFGNALGNRQSVLQILIVAALIAAFVIIAFFAVANPAKRRKRREEKIHDVHEKLVVLKNKILAIDDEMKLIDEKVEKAETDAQTKMNALIERERQIYESELINKAKCKDKISEVEGKQRIITELQRKQQTGMIQAMKKPQSDKPNSKRADVLEKNIADINRNLETFRLEQKVRKDALSTERDSLENELDRLLLVDKKLCKRKNSSPSAKNEILKLRTKRETEIKLLEELRIAKEEYESACQKRIQAERNRKIAIENLKREEEEKRKLAELIRQSENNTTHTEHEHDVPPLDTRDVQLIISDPDGDGTPILSEIPVKNESEEQTIAKPEENDDSQNQQTYEQLSFAQDLPYDDEVVFTQADAYADESSQAEKSANEKENAEPLPESDKTDLTLSQSDNTDALNKMPSANIEGFTPKEPLNLWKIVRPDNKFIAYLTVRGRKIARTNLCTDIVDVKKAIKRACRAISKKRVTFINESGKYYFVATSEHGDVILTGEKQYSEEACKTDANLLAEVCRCDIKEIL